MKIIRFSALFVLFFMFSCGEEKKEDKSKNEVIVKEEEQPKKQESAEVIVELLKSGKELQVGKTGFAVLVSKEKIFWFKKDKDVLEKDIDDSVIITIFYFNKKQKQLSFNLFDFLEDSFQYNNEKYMLAEFDYEYDDDISTIQVGQYSKTESKTTWNLSVSKNLIKK